MGNGAVAAPAVAQTSCDPFFDPGSGVTTAVGGVFTFQIILGPDCTWTATSNNFWIQVITVAGSGTGVVSYRVETATQSQDRTGLITVASGRSHNFAVFQPGCRFSVSPQISQLFSAAGGTGTFTITTETCVWSVEPNIIGTGQWVFITDPVPVGGVASGRGSRTITYFVAENKSSIARDGVARVFNEDVGFQDHIVKQQGAACTLAIFPESASFPAQGGPGSVDVFTPGGCDWNAASTVSWITIPFGSSFGNATIGYGVAENTTTLNRTGPLTSSRD